VKARLDEYHRQTAPILPHYAAQGMLRAVDGMAPSTRWRARLTRLCRVSPRT